MPNHPLGPLAANGSSKHDGAIYRGNQAAARGSQPTLSVDEQIDCKQAVLASPEFLAALEKHYAITGTSLVMA